MSKQAKRGNAALPTTRAEHKIVPWIKEKKNLALPSSRAVSGSPKGEIQRKSPPLLATRVEHGTMRKQETKPHFGAKKIKEKK
ncbi:uncharacterized protein DS421_3g86630 [Arachis hypogaea]|nr:uncharacterized protein DS421_3g86630 [Arachis hypogaea]